MKHFYSHGDLVDAADAGDGVDAPRFYDERLDQFIVVSRRTTVATHEDLRMVKLLITGGLGGLRYAKPPFLEDNVFGSSRKLRRRLTKRNSAAQLEKEKMALAARLAAHDRLMAKLVCRNCRRGKLHHVDGKCLFDSTEWTLGKPRKT
jgi:hypothetical protein